MLGQARKVDLVQLAKVPFVDGRFAEIALRQLDLAKGSRSVGRLPYRIQIGPFRCIWYCFWRPVFRPERNVRRTKESVVMSTVTIDMVDVFCLHDFGSPNLVRVPELNTQHAGAVAEGVFV